MEEITIIGGGLAGCEAAWQVAKRGGRAVIHEMKPERFSPAHTLPTLAELVCSNSLKSEGLENASGVLKAEMRILGSLVLKAADSARVPAGKTLAVDRAAFSVSVTEALKSAGVRIERGEVASLPSARPLIIATGPLTSDAFASVIRELAGKESLNFYDAVAPIVHAESIDMESAFFASRYGKGGDDYINCPMTKEEYEAFYAALTEADRVASRSFEKAECFEACMPIEEMASRGAQTLLFGPMRPVGLSDPKSGQRPYAVVQLRRENASGTLYNMVGFQTRLKYPDQKRVFSLIPALKNAEFARYGKLHRNSYLDSPDLLTPAQQLRGDPSIFFAGQITGVEGYCESSASGIMAGINALRYAQGKACAAAPPESMVGALLNHISSAAGKSFSPMNANMGLLPPQKGRNARELQAARALEAMRAFASTLS